MWREYSQREVADSDVANTVGEAAVGLWIPFLRKLILVDNGSLHRLSSGSAASLICPIESGVGPDKKIC